MILRRVLNNTVILEYIINEIGLSQKELLLPVNLEDVFYTIFAKQVYKGKREATVISWVLARITDGLGGKYPRELINLANYAKNEQIEIGSYEADCLISGRLIKRAFNKVSTTKCNTYLSEFPGLREHFELVPEYKSRRGSGMRRPWSQYRENSAGCFLRTENTLRKAGVFRVKRGGNEK